MYFVDTIVFVLCVSGSRKRFISIYIYISFYIIFVFRAAGPVSSDLFNISLSTQPPLFHSISNSNSCYAFSFKNHFNSTVSVK